MQLTRARSYLSVALVVMVAAAVTLGGGAAADDEDLGVGIDFGLETSVLAVVRNGRAQVVASEPTYVSFTEQPNAKAAKKGDPLPFLTNVGRAAKATLVTAPTNTIHGFRALLGRKFDHPSVTELKASGVLYSIQKTGENTPAVQLTVSGQKVAFSPEQLTAMVLQRLKATAEAVLGGRKVRDVVLTVPTDFEADQIAALVSAAKTSGFSGSIVTITDSEATARGLRASVSTPLQEAAALGAVLTANPSYDHAAAIASEKEEL